MPKLIYEKSSNSELVLELIEVLKEEASLFETFLELLEKQQRALVKNDVAELNRITGLQHQKALDSRRLSKNREELVRKLSSDGVSKEDLTISRLIESVSSGQAVILGQLKKTILELNEKISRMRNQNEMLIDRSRENIVMTMELLGKIGAPNSNYQNHGKVDPMNKNIALDRRI
jgi:hypothetical protein